ncbi:flagellar hook-length control protein FliK [Sporosarcina sp. HYO08]|uniref:flagellar hook-length control protein FliK n=1 Tax=Sporosarcina sp. HYO08 TaxID=1759557 RepID=UPI00079CC317|nr:flagellar hook-length control protein FliK [Sporosarcina sp. HYO08]KXH79984.1 hypothetical protein AU377_10955 [Sporosarcina sp. HYO08]
MGVASGTFGAVLQQITNNPCNSFPVEHQVNPEAQQFIQSVLQVTTLEQLAEIIGEQSALENDAMGSVEQKDTIIPLLEQLGVELPQIDRIDSSLGLLMAIDQLGQPFFTALLDSLEGRGEFSEKQVAAIIVELKMIALHLVEIDGTWEQQQAVNTLQDRFNGLEKQLDTIGRTNEGVSRPIQPYYFGTNLESVQEKGAIPKNGLAEEVKSIPMHTVSSSTSGQMVDRVETVHRQENFMRDLQMIFKRSNFGQTGGTQRLLIKLYPEQLGQIRIELLQSNGVLTARILTSTTLGKELLDSQLTQLRNAFVQQSLHVERIDISQSIQQPYKSDRDQSFNEHFGREQQETTDEQQKSDKEEQSFEEYLLEVEV